MDMLRSIGKQSRNTRNPWSQSLASLSTSPKLVFDIYYKLNYIHSKNFTVP